MVVEEPTAAQFVELWRAAERRRDALMPGSTAHEMAAAECDALAAAYREHLDTREVTARRLVAPDEGNQP